MLQLHSRIAPELEGKYCDTICTRTFDGLAVCATGSCRNNLVTIQVGKIQSKGYLTLDIKAFLLCLSVCMFAGCWSVGSIAKC